MTEQTPVSVFNHSLSLYLAAVLIWGSTWYAIKFQLGTVAPEISVAYRFALAAVLLFIYCKLRGLSLVFNYRQHCAMLMLGICLFGVNYVLVYQATAYLTSGLVAVSFSSIVLMNIFNGALLLKQAVVPRELLGAILGIAGISLVFWPELQISLAPTTGKGLLLALLATYIASLGNLISGYSQARGLPVIQANTYGMAYGALLIAVWAGFRGIPFNYELSLEYTLSLLYLSLFGSVLAFGSYLTLLGRIGASKAAYATVLFPIVALTISTLFENYHWPGLAVLGMLLVVLGNLLIISHAGLRQSIRRRLLPNKTKVEAQS